MYNIREEENNEREREREKWKSMTEIQQNFCQANEFLFVIRNVI